MPTVYNPGEVVFDQATGEPYVDENGALLEVAPGLIVNAPDGTTHDGDDVTNAAWLRGNLHEGEVLRDATRGVAFSRVVLGQPDAGLAVTAVIAEIRSATPGVEGVVDARVLAFDPQRRVLRFAGALLRADGTEQDVTFGIG